MQELNSKLRIEILSTIDELNQYLNGNVTTEALQDLVASQDKYIMQLETYVYELTDKDSPEEYKAVIRNEIFNSENDGQ